MKPGTDGKPYPGVEVWDCEKLVIILIIIYSHKRKDGSFVNQRAENIVNDLQKALDAATQHKGSIDHEQLYFDVVGSKGGRVYGMGDHSDAMIRRSKMMM